jgi:hypothetical protein
MDESGHGEETSVQSKSERPHPAGAEKLINAHRVKALLKWKVL